MPLSRWKGMTERTWETRTAVTSSLRMYLQITTIYTSNHRAFKMTLPVSHFACHANLLVVR